MANLYANLTNYWPFCTSLFHWYLNCPLLAFNITNSSLRVVLGAMVEMVSYADEQGLVRDAEVICVQQ